MKFFLTILLISIIGTAVALNKCATQKPVDKKNLIGQTTAKLKSITIFNVKKYGAKGDGISNDTAAILAAISAAKSSNIFSEIYFPAGIYNVSSSNEYALQLKSLSDIRLKGEGTNSVLMVSNPLNGCLGFSYCTNISIESIVIDYDPLPFTQGTITAVNLTDGTYDLLIDSGYPELSHPAFSIAESRWGITVDLSRKAYGLWSYFSSSWTNINKRTWRMKADDHAYLKAQPLLIGDRYAHMARRWTAFDIGCNYCTGVKINNVTIYASSGLTVGLIYCNKIHINELNVSLKPGSNRLLSTNGDCVHSAGCTGGLTIKNCYFAGMPDDGINIHGRGGVIVSNITDTIKRVGTPRPAFFAAGDEIQILNNKLGGSRGSSKIINAVQIRNVEWEITLDKPFPKLNADWSLGDKLNSISRCGQNSVIKNNSFGAHRGRDVLLRSHNILVTSNYFFNPSLAWESVCLENRYTYYAEGPASYNINISGNTFVGGTNHWSWSAPAIGIHSYLTGWNLTPSYDSSNIIIKGNTFINIDGPAIQAATISNVRIIDNKVNTELGIKKVTSPVVLIEKAKNILIDNLKIKDLNPKTYAGIHIKSSVSSSPESVIITNLTAKLAPVSKVVLDDRTKTKKLQTNNLF